MIQDAEIARLESQVDALSAENASLRESGFRGSKAEALLAFEYDRIPNAMKTLRAIAAHGTDYMYKGPWAEKLVAAVQARTGK